MAMTVIWTGMVVVSILCGRATGNGPAVAAAAMEGAAAAVELCLSMAGVLCLWMGVMEVMRRSGLSDGLSRLLRPVLRRLYPEFARDREVMDTISANVSANLLGLGNAATPLGLEAARRMGLELIPVKQGYAKCSLCIVSENAVITADEGLAYTLCRAGLDVLKIIPGCIRLPGYGYGFIGGCCGKLDAATMAFAGDPLTHPDGKKILSFMERHGVKPRNLLGQGEKLIDIGSILPVMQE